MLKFNNIEIELDKIYSLEIGTASVNASGIGKIQRMYDIILPNDFDRNWISPKGGAFSKRLSKFLKKNSKVEFDETKFSALCAELKNKYCTIPKVHYFDITQNFKWRSGDFKDNGSCFWNYSYDGGYRQTLTDLGSFAFRLFESPNGLVDGRGLGRCWMTPISVDDDGNPLVLAAYNAYGPELRPQMEILSRFLGFSLKESNVCIIEGPTNNGLYLNNGGNSILIGREEDLNRYVDRIDLGKLLYKYHCWFCSSGFARKDSLKNKKDGKLLCIDCLAKVEVCPVCSVIKHNKDFINLVNTKTKTRTRRICRACNNVRKTQEAQEETEL